MAEQVLRDSVHAHGTSAIALRYFNAAGADPDGDLSEQHDPETHLIPRAILAAWDKLPELEVFGGDYPTPDGTCIRDYIHVTDLANGHVQALRHVTVNSGYLALNLGTERGISVMEVLGAVERIVGRRVPFAIRSRRPGDPAVLVATASAARQTIGFNPRHSDLDTMVRTANRALGN